MSKNNSQTDKRISAGQWSVAWRRYRKNKVGLFGTAIVALFVFAAIFGPYITPYEPRSIDSLFDKEWSQPPSWKHPFGTTIAGYDVFSEVIHAARNNLIVSLLAISISMSIAIIIGAISGYFGGKIDTALMSFSEIFLVIPVFFFALIFLRIFLMQVASGFGLYIVILLLGLFYWAANARLVRGEFLAIREMEFVQASRTIGASNIRLIFRHILPNILPSVIVVTSLGVAEITIIEAGLGFLGFGDPNTITWGLLLQEGYIHTRLEWWGMIFPGLAVLLFVLGFNLMGDALQDSLNPKLREN